MRQRSCLILAAVLAAATAFSGSVWAQTSAPAGSSTGSAPPSKTPFEQITTGAKKVEGLWTIYYKDQAVLVDFSPAHLNQNFIVLTSIARGVSRMPVLGGMSWGFGDDVVWTFRKVGEKLHVIRRNVRFRANPGSPESTAVSIAYSDSVLYALPIVTTSPSGGMLVDFTRIFFSDDEMIGRSIGAAFSPERSTVAKIKAFPRNVEVEIAAVYSGQMDFDTVPDPRGMQVHVHYSISLLPQTGYTPRLADDRVGYFLTVVKDFSDKKDSQQFVRYINRWQLQKADPSAKLSPPKEPIVFYLEKTVPIHLRPIVRAGIEEWNKAYEKLGFANAIEVRQQRDDDDWDPEDIRYNTFRWITANAGFAMGPSRVNPLTGQILDADIIFDSSFLTFWKQDYETFTSVEVASIFGADYEAKPDTFNKLFGSNGLFHRHHSATSCNYCQGKQRSMGHAAAVMAARAEGDVNAAGQVPEEFIAQGLKEVVMHEVGHTLGLRHNFKASSWKTLAEIDDPAKGGATVASVMDYTPANIAPKGVKQGLYYPTTLGPYDEWAIEYGYKVIAGDEAAELKKIASRGAEAGLDYATDEDTRGITDPDPLVNRFDLGKDPLEFARREMKISSELWGKVVDRAVAPGEGYQKARQAFGMMFSQYMNSLSFVARFPGGVYVHRDHKGDPNGRAPFKLVEAARQREAMKLLNDHAFNVPPIPPDMLNHLAATRWSHWGMRDTTRLDYPIHDTIMLMQSRVLFQLLSSPTLSRLHDSEIKAPPEADVYTLAEHLKLINDGVFTEIRTPGKEGQYTNRQPYISSMRRNLQRIGLKELASLVTSPTRGLPEDIRTLARLHLNELNNQIDGLLKNEKYKLDDYTRAHLLDSQERLKKALSATVVTPSVD